MPHALSPCSCSTFAIVGAACAVLGACTHRFPHCRPGGPGNLAASVNRVGAGRASSLGCTEGRLACWAAGMCGRTWVLPARCRVAAAGAWDGCRPSHSALLLGLGTAERAMHGKPTCLPCCTRLPYCCAWHPHLQGSPTYNCPLLPPLAADPHASNRIGQPVRRGGGDRHPHSLWPLGNVSGGSCGIALLDAPCFLPAPLAGLLPVCLFVVLASGGSSAVCFCLAATHNFTLELLPSTARPLPPWHPSTPCRAGVAAPTIERHVRSSRK